MNTGQPMPVVIQPLPVDFEAYDCHVILYLKGHKDYESIEAMIRENNSGKPFIRAVITLHGGLQINHINDEAFAGISKQSKKYTKIYFSTVKYESIYKKKYIEINLSFTSYRNEEIVLHFITAGKAKSPGTGLLNPGRRSYRLTLPVIYPELTSNAGKGSYVTINGQYCGIPVIAGKLPAFSRLKGYYSEHFNIADLRAGTRNIQITASPSAARAGEEWVYKLNGKSESYRISDIQENIITIQGDSCVIIAAILNNDVFIEHMTFHTIKPCKDFMPRLTIAFTPPVPAFTSLNTGVFCNSKFSISLNNHNDLVTGKVQANTANGVLSLALLPLEPEWAAARQVHLTIKKQGTTQFCIKTKISPGWFKRFYTFK